MKVQPLQMPKRVEFEEKTMTDRFGRFYIEPLERGYGHTVGNALRRVLLSSLPGAAITAVRIQDALHEFTSLPGVYEDTTQIILNLKRMRFRMSQEGPVRGHFEKRGKGELKAGDVEIDPAVQVLNPELHVATLNDEAELVVDVEIGLGRGYVVADQHPNVERADRGDLHRFALLAGGTRQHRGREHADWPAALNIRSPSSRNRPAEIGNIPSGHCPVHPGNPRSKPWRAHKYEIKQFGLSSPPKKRAVN